MALGAKSPSPARFNWRVVGSTESLKNSNRIGGKCSAVYVCLVHGETYSLLFLLPSGEMPIVCLPHSV